MRLGVSADLLYKLESLSSRVQHMQEIQASKEERLPLPRASLGLEEGSEEGVLGSSKKNDWNSNHVHKLTAF